MATSYSCNDCGETSFDPDDFEGCQMDPKCQGYFCPVACAEDHIHDEVA